MPKFNDSPVLKSSEIAQYEYCPVTLYHLRSGLKPESTHIDSGAQIHVTMGQKIDEMQVKEERAGTFSTFGWLLVGLAILALIGWLIFL